MTLESKVASIESEIKSLKDQTDRNREHISDLLTSKNKLEGGLRVMAWILGFLGISNCVAAMYIFAKAATVK